MAYKVKFGIYNSIIDKRCKLLPCQKERIVSMFGDGLSKKHLGRIFKVSDSTISAILQPEKYREKRRESWMTKYYNKDKHKASNQRHRHFVKEIRKRHGINHDAFENSNFSR